MNIRNYLSWLALVGCLALSGFQAVPNEVPPPLDRPNIVLIVADDHGTDALGCYGNPVIQTPNLDGLAADGVRFNRAYCTTASCSASRSVILSGKFNHTTGQYGHTHAYHHFQTFDTIRTLPVLLQAAGYRTARIGKYHVAPESVYHFEEALPGSARNPVAMAQNCEDFLSQKSDQPFFLYFCTADPHRGGGKLERWETKPDRFGNQDAPRPGLQKITYDPADVQVPDFLPDLPTTRAELSQYYESVSRVDQGVGSLLEYLKSIGEYENTLIIYLSDNGMAFPGAKTTLYEPGMRLPCIAKYPGQQEGGRVSNTRISWVDLMPTLLDYAETRPGDLVLHGLSFRQTLEGKPDNRPDVAYASHSFHEITMYYPMRSVQLGKYKLIWNLAHGLEYPSASDLWESATWQGALESGTGKLGPRPIENYLHRPKWELFDLQADPGELNNLASNPRFGGLLNRMQLKLRIFMTTTKDPWLYKWEYE
ncbi:MAG: sulfatase [Bacteroidota bacterium]